MEIMLITLYTRKCYFYTLLTLSYSELYNLFHSDTYNFRIILRELFWSAQKIDVIIHKIILYEYNHIDKNYLNLFKQSEKIEWKNIKLYLPLTFILIEELIYQLVIIIQ
jgi:hypothetical protein